jgi:hypothetical protein
MIVIVADWFPIYKNGIPTGQKEYVASHGVDIDTGRNIIVSADHPSKLGARFNEDLGEWVIE